LLQQTVYRKTVGDQSYSPVITNCIFYGHQQPAIRESSAIADPNVTYCCFYNNSGGDWYDYDSSTILTGAQTINNLPEAGFNIDFDPLFIQGNYHLQEDSACIDRGHPEGDYNSVTDIDGQPRVFGLNIDIGCDEFWTIGDLNCDGYVDWLDLAIFSQYWLKNTDCRADFNHNKKADLSDFAALAENWLVP